MKKRTMILYFHVVLFMLAGCVGNTNEESTTDSSENNSAIESTEEDPIETDESTSARELGESDMDDENEISSDESGHTDSDRNSSENGDLDAGDKEDKETLLSQYSSEEIEYARVWLQLGPNQEIDELNVRHIPAGEPIHPNDDTSASYPEDVIQLAGSRLVDGSVTYSGNGDGTVHVYNVPLRWDSNDAADVDENFMREYTADIIENTELVYVDPGDEEEIIEFIEVLNVHN